MYVWLIDLDSATDFFRLYFDDQLIQDLTTVGSSWTYTKPNICGGSKGDYPLMRIDGRSVHSDTQLVLKLKSMFDGSSNTALIGIRDLSLLFQTNSVSTNSTCNFVTTTSSSPSCSCNIGEYSPIGSGGCHSCSNICNTCFASSSTLECTSCHDGQSFDGQTCFQCNSACQQCNGTTASDCVRCYPGMYLYWNGTCQSSCNTPLIATTISNYSSCSMPCNLSEYYYQNSTCKSSCNAPFVQYTQGDLKYCNFSCTAPSLLYWNGSCISSCSFPLTNTTNGIERYCNLPCGNSSYYYQNSSCISSCLAPFVQYSQGDLKYCNFPCSTSSYLYWNGSCIPGCASPLINTTNGIERYCSLPCNNSSYYLYPNLTCKLVCPSPFLITIQGDLK